MADENACVRVCQKLDSLVLDYFETLERISEMRLQLDTTLRDGFFHMAKARYSMGNKCVTALQYDDREMVAMKRVQELVDPDRTYPTFCLVSHHAIPSTVPVDDSSVKNRGGPGVTSTPVISQSEVLEDSDDTDDEDCPLIETKIVKADVIKKCSSAAPRDPIKWFGVLVPQALRHSQVSFQRSLAVVCELAQLQAKLENIKVDFAHAMKETKSIGYDDAERES